MDMLEGAIIHFLGAGIFMFLFWKKLKEDYLSSQIFSTSFLIFIGIAILLLISKFYFPSWWFWFGVLGFFLGYFISVSKFKLKFYESFEAGLIFLLPWLSIYFLSSSIKNKSWFSLAEFAVTSLAIFLYFILNSRYKNFSWYKSGRVGFAGLTTIGIYFLIRGLIAIFFPFMLSFAGDYEPIFSGIVAFTFFLLVFNLSRLNP